MFWVEDPQLWVPEQAHLGLPEPWELKSLIQNAKFGPTSHLFQLKSLKHQRKLKISMYIRLVLQAFLKVWFRWSPAAKLSVEEWQPIWISECISISRISISFLTVTAFIYQYAGKSYDLLSCSCSHMNHLRNGYYAYTVFGSLLLSEVALSSLRIVRTIVNLSLK